MLKLSLCMIAKDEESVIGRCLKSALNSGAIDEIILVDTGSTDETKKIAARYGAKVYDFPWINDFSAARNHSFAKATGDYILWLDADDYIDEENAKKLFDLKSQIEKKRVSGAFCRYSSLSSQPQAQTKARFPQDLPQTQSSATLIYYRMRLVKNDDRAVWSGKVHECLPRFPDAIRSDFTVQHLGSDKARAKRNLEIYREQIEKGEKFCPRDLFYYGRELFYHGYFTESVAIEEKFLLQSDAWYVNKIEACKIVAACKFREGDTKGAKAALFSSFLYGAPRAGILCELGNIFKQEKNFSAACFWYRAAKNAEDHAAEGDFENPEDRTVTPAIEAVYCAYAAGNKTLAKTLHEECEILCPAHPAVKYNRAFFLSRDEES